jgi:hypothetical protein
MKDFSFVARLRLNGATPTKTAVYDTDPGTGERLSTYKMRPAVRAEFRAQYGDERPDDWVFSQASPAANADLTIQNPVVAEPLFDLFTAWLKDPEQSYQDYPTFEVTFRLLPPA